MATRPPPSSGGASRFLPCQSPADGAGQPRRQVGLSGRTSPPPSGPILSRRHPLGHLPHSGATSRAPYGSVTCVYVCAPGRIRTCDARFRKVLPPRTPTPTPPLPPTPPSAAPGCRPTRARPTVVCASPGGRGPAPALVTWPSRGWRSRRPPASPAGGRFRVLARVSSLTCQAWRATLAPAPMRSRWVTSCMKAPAGAWFSGHHPSVWSAAMRRDGLLRFRSRMSPGSTPGHPDGV